MQRRFCGIRKRKKMGKEMKWKLKNEISGLSYNTGEEKGNLQRKGEVSFITFPSFEKLDFIRHGFSTREGGVSEGVLGTMNLSYTRGDEPERVDENYKRICEALGFLPERLVLSDQVHDTKVQRVGSQDCQGKNLREKKLKGIDGLITNEENVVLCTSYADCVPLYFVDTAKKAIGHSHSGWRGTVGKIGAKTVERMREEFGTRPEDLVVVIGPSICQECYEVSKDVYDAFVGFVNKEKIAAAQKMSIEKVQSMIESVFEEKEQEKYQLDLWMANKLILMEAGVPEAQINISCVCTCCNHKILFSHRASQGKRGNLAGFLSLI